MPTRLRIREFLIAKPKLGRELASTLVRLDKWAASVLTNPGSAPPGRNAAPKANVAHVSNTIESIANELVGQTKETERMLLSKSLQETLFYCVGFDPNISHAEFMKKFVRYLKRHGAAPFIQRFLSLYFFNYVWFETRESFMAVAATAAAFKRDMENVERVCRTVVASVWKSFDATHRPLNLAAANELVRAIEQGLRNPVLPNKK